MKVLNNISLTGNPDIDKHLVAKTNLFEDLEYEYSGMVVSNYFYNYLNQKLDKTAFKNFLETYYPEGFVAILNSYMQNSSESFLSFYFESPCDFDEIYTAHDFTSTCIQNEIWLDEIADCLIENPDLFGNEYNKDLADELSYTAYMTKNIDILHKLSHYPDVDIQEEADIKIRKLIFASSF